MLPIQQEQVARLSSAWTLDADHVAALLGVEASRGLSSEDAKSRLLEAGPNSLPGGRRDDTLVQALISQLLNFLIVLLLAATALAVAIGELVQAVTILAIIVLAVALGGIQDWRAQRAISTLKRMSAPEARVLRDGISISIPAEQLVPGDIVLLDPGTAVPADLRILESHQLRANEASLTGEFLPQEKDAGVVLAGATPLGDRVNCAYAGTTVTYGRGLGVVVATGQHTELGHIAVLLGEKREEQTPLQRSLASLSRSVGLAAIAISILVFVVGIVNGLDWEETALASIGLAVAAVPEGLPAIVVICLALGMQRMARHRALIRRLAAVETLGCATVIVTDKTGTLTTGRMTATTVLLPRGDRLSVTGAGYEPEGEFRIGDVPIDPRADRDLPLLLAAAVLCNDARLERAEDGWRVAGDITEGALMVLARKGGLSWEEQEERQPRTHEIPFTSERAAMITVHELPGETIVYAKGAPERIIGLCAAKREGGQVHPLTAADADAVLSSATAMAASGMRVIALAYSATPGAAGPVTGDEANLILLGLAGLDDPPREGAVEAIRACHNAGIRPLLVTGDHPATALTIARRLGLAGPDDVAVIGVELEAMSDADLATAVQRHTVFARATAAQKLQIVKALQSAGETVAVTGDGVNDAPALERAEIGVAMGITGTDVAKAASDIIITDDNFASIVTAIQEGRRIYDNIRNVVVYLLGGNTGEILVIFVGVSVGLPLPLLAVQILLVNLATDGAPAIALAVEKGDPASSLRHPRGRDEPMLSAPVWRTIIARGVLVAAAVLFTFTLSYKVLDYDLTTSRTIGFTTLVFAHVVMSFTCRSLYLPVWKLAPAGNTALLVGVSLSLGLLLLVIEVPPLQDAFETTRLDAGEWALAVGAAFAPLGLIEALKVSPWRLRR